MDNFTIVIPFFNGHQHIGRLLDSIPEGLEVIIVDDISDDPLTAVSRSTEKTKIIRMEKKGYFTGAVNRGISECSTDVLVLNQDTWLEGSQWLSLLQEKRSQYAIIGEGIQGNHPAWPKGYVHGTFMFMRRDAIDDVGLMNARDYPLWGSTCEWQVRICRAGYKAMVLPSVPGFNHKRGKGENFGSSIKTILDREPKKRSVLIQTPPAISVIIPCYNYGRWLPDCIASLVGGETSLGVAKQQSFASFEVIIVDDASTDASSQIIEKLVDPWKGIRSIRLEPTRHDDGMNHHGVPVALNEGIRRARGKYITYVGADDMMEPTRLEELYRASVKNPHSMVYDDAWLFKNGKRFEHWKMQEYNFEQLLAKNHVHCGIMYPKKGWQEAGGYPENMRYGREDWAFNVALGIKGYCGVHVKKPLYLYRREGHNRTLRNTSQKWHNRFSAQIQSQFPSIYAGVRPMGCCGGKRGSAILRGTQKVGGAEMMAIKDLAGVEGMTILKFAGKGDSDFTWYGEKTGQRYTLGGIKRTGYVDNKDVPGFLKIVEDGRILFRVATPDKDAEVKISTKEAVKVNEPIVETTSSDIPQNGSVEEGITDSPDYTALSVTNLKKEIPNMSIDILYSTIEAEKNGKNRVTAVNALQAEIDSRAVLA